MAKSKAHLETLLYKLRNCLNWDALFALEEDFNQIGLTLQPTTKERVVLCKIKDGQPSAERICEDYMFLANATERNTTLSERHIEVISDFCINASSAPATLEGNPRRKWMHGVQTYGKIIVVNEDIQYIASTILE